MKRKETPFHAEPRGRLYDPYRKEWGDEESKEGVREERRHRVWSHHRQISLVDR